MPFILFVCASSVQTNTHCSIYHLYKLYIVVFNLYGIHSVCWSIYLSVVIAHMYISFAMTVEHHINISSTVGPLHNL